MTPHSFTNLGGFSKPYDVQDVILGAVAAAPYTFPPTLINTDAWAAPVEYQGQQPACGGHAGASLKTIDNKAHFTPRFTWADTKTIDGLPIQDGTDMRSIFKSITKTGTLDFNLLGNDVTLSEQTYAIPPLTSLMRGQARPHSGEGYGFITDRSFNGLKQFIDTHGPSLMLMKVGAEMWTSPTGVISWAEKDILPMRPPSKIVSGHFVVIHSYDEQYIYFLNSWSDSWGRKGHGYFGANYMSYIEDVGTLYPLAFTKDLYRGMTDPDVLRLQVELNKNPLTRIAATGPGSPGNESNFFGGLTYAAVVEFQRLNSILPVSGYVGALTRATLGS